MPETVDLNAMSDAEIADLAMRCMEVLELAEKVQVVVKVFHEEGDRAELASWLNEPEEEEEED